MDDLTHDSDGSQIDIAGYRSCRNAWCGALVLVEITHRTKGLCVQCFQANLGAAMAEVEVRSRGQLLHAPLKRHPKSDIRSGGKGNRWTDRQAGRARKRAEKRLRILFPDLFEVLYAEERARAGLDPFPLEKLVEPVDVEAADVAISFAKMLHQLEDADIDVRGLSSQGSSNMPPTTTEQ